MTTFGAVVRRGGRWLPVIGVASLVGTVTTLALPTVLGRAVDAVVSGEPVSRSLLVAAGIIALAVVSDLVDSYAAITCVADTTAWLRNALARHVLAIGPERASRFDTGDLVSRVSGSAGEAAAAGPSVVTIGSSVLPPVGCVVLLAYINPWLAVTFVGSAALVVVVLVVFARRSADVMTSYQKTQGRISALLSEALGGARTMAAAGTVEHEEARVLGPLPELHGLGVRTWQLLARTVAQSAVIGPLVMVGVLSMAGVQLARGQITPGELFAASQYAVIGAGLGGMTGVFAALARARAGVRRAAEVLTVAPVEYGERTLGPGLGRLEFRKVTVLAGDSGAHPLPSRPALDTPPSGATLHTPPSRPTLLDSIDLTLPGGLTIAVVGPSGAGKSVLAAVAARLREPDAGEVLLDGVPMATLRRDALRRSVGVAFERPVLVGETLTDAIGLGVGRAEVEQAARATHAHEFVSRLPRGYDTALVDAPMSGGERQRLGLARAWFANRLLVMDDATSSLDMVTEMQISHALTNGAFPSNRSRLIVTHRSTTAARSDLVVWLEAGRVRAVGTHGELWEQPDYRSVFG